MLKVKLLNSNARVPTVAHPGEDLGGIIMCISDKAIQRDRQAKEDFSHGGSPICVVALLHSG